jgi:DNA repair exonuclease SbcCD ATPase subunit
MLLRFSVRRSGLLALVGAAIVTAGCHTAPNMKPFSDATSQLSASVKASGRAVTNEIEIVTKDWPSKQKASVDTVSARFNTHWVQRGKLADALNDYAASLAAIVEAGEQGEASAAALAKSFGKLCDAVGAVLPPALAGDVVANAASKVYGMFAKDRAARTLAGNMKNMQGELDNVVGVLEKDLTTIEQALADLRVEAKQSFEDTTISAFQPRIERSVLTASTERLSKLRVSMFSATNELDAARERLSRAAAGDAAAAQKLLNSPGDNQLAQQAAAAASLHQATQREVDTLEKSITLLSQQLSSAESSIAHSVQRLAPIDEQIAQAQARIDAEIRLVQTTREGLSTWASTHARLAEAASERKPPNVEELVQIATEIRELVKQVRTAQK